MAGTKGKGSTCAFVNSFLRAHQQRTGFPRRIGLYTSPHLKRVQERLQIDSRPISEDAFAKYVFEVWYVHLGLVEFNPSAHIPYTDCPSKEYMNSRKLLILKF